MPVRIRIARTLWTGRVGRILLLGVLTLILAGAASFAYAWRHFSRLIDARLSGEIFEKASHIYAAPERLSVGDEVLLGEITAQLRRFGYGGPDEESSAYGSYRRTPNTLDVLPGPASQVGPEQAVRIETEEGQVTRIRSLRDHRLLDFCWIDPAHVTNLFDRRRTKRRLVHYEDMPPELIQAVIAAEDKRYFDHPGISVVDGLRALWYDIRLWLGLQKGSRPQGASTLTMQLARSFFLNRDLSLKRKMAEALIALQLERRFSKEKILELYANEIYLGQRGSFSVHGFGEGAQAYFDKDISQLTLAEAALLAGLVRGPNYYNPYRHPKRALTRRNYILAAMQDIGALTPERTLTAQQELLTLPPLNVESSEAPYFVDLVRDHLLGYFSEQQLVSRSYRVYTSLDLKLQRAAAEAIREALPEVDARIEERFRHRKQPPPEAQVALIAMDPRSGAVKALVGGRDYTRSQLNRAVAQRQPGSGFKPFVYAAAFHTALETPENAITPVTTVVDEPTIFEFEGEPYEPSNYGEKFYGIVTVRDALIHSLNVATVKVAEMTGYDRVAELAAAAGLNPRVQGTPAIALGAYDSTPLEVAGAYTLFANGGEQVDPVLISRVLTSDGTVLQENTSEPRPVLDPRVAYLVADILQDTINRGTGAGARARGFSAPAAGKTGTSRDAWFIGFTSNLLCVVWVGFDDSSDLGLPGSAAALPIWTAFMKRAVSLPAYATTEDFIPPEGIVSVPLDPETLLLAIPECPEVRTERFILGTEPREFCPKHRPPFFRRVTRGLSRALGIRRGEQERRRKPGAEYSPRPDASAEDGAPPPAARAEPPRKRRRGLLSRAASFFRRKRNKESRPPQRTAGEEKKKKEKPSQE